MNRLHRWYCRSNSWREKLENEILPWALKGVDLDRDVLEIGPGPGLTTKWLRQRCGSLTCLEMDSKLAGLLEQRLAGSGVHLDLGDATAMPYRDSSFSAVVAFTMLHHVPSAALQDQLCAEAYRVLRPGAIFAGVDSMSTSDLASLKITEITGRHATQFAARNSTLKASTINCGLRTLRRALNLAFEWGKLDKPVRVPLAKGERQRDRVLTDAEITLYLDNCRQPWKDAATLILGTGMRPGEVYGLRWEFVLLNGSGGLVQVSEGKSKTARRILPVIPDVYRMLKARHEAQGKPSVGWVFPSTAKHGHLEQGTGKTQHSSAIAKVNAETLKANAKLEAAGEKPLPLPLPPFEPYVMRHTALTRMSPFCDAFTLARIAGHSSITITQRYFHPPGRCG